ncbi:MAG TPA: class I SAM-dependent methyltransferase [Longimicrobiales bacterium]|nr:class I SAM-dependent methyltransferase [Longimicrobiales bacterium]
MSSEARFEADWLELREPADHRARPEAVVRALVEAGSSRGWSRVLDLGAGTGSNLRYLDPRLPWVRHWTLVDHDPALLVRATDPAPGRTLRRVPGDLATEGLDAVQGADVVTASALLDLVSGAWLDRLVGRCAAAGAGVLFALTWDGVIRWEPEDPDDEVIRAAVAAHQLRDKGLGRALGPGGAEAARSRLSAAGYRTEEAASPWILEGRGDASLALALIRGWAEAALDVAPEAEVRVERWLRRRTAAVAAGAFHLEVGHRDLLGLPGT